MARKNRNRKDDAAVKEALDGLRDVLDLTLTRVIENDMDHDETERVLTYLRKELNNLERGIGGGGRESAGKRPRRRKTAAGKRPSRPKPHARK